MAGSKIVLLIFRASLFVMAAGKSSSNVSLPCSFQVVGVAIGDTALVGKLLLLALGIEPGDKKRLALRIKTMSRNK